VDDIAARRWEAALGQIERPVRQGRDHAHGRRRSGGATSTSSHGSWALTCSGHRRPPRGRWSRSRPESSGKTRCACSGAEVQSLARRRLHRRENALDPATPRSSRQGFRHAISQPDTGEQGLEIADMLVAQTAST